MVTWQPFGQLREIRLVRDKVTKLSRGFAFIEFHETSAAKVWDPTRTLWDATHTP